VIHSDFEKGFIRAEIVSYEDVVKFGNEKAVKDQGTDYCFVLNNLIVEWFDVAYQGCPGAKERSMSCERAISCCSGLTRNHSLVNNVIIWTNFIYIAVTATEYSKLLKILLQNQNWRPTSHMVSYCHGPMYSNMRRNDILRKKPSFSNTDAIIIRNSLHFLDAGSKQL
jgi:hypothetical protein